MPQMAPYNWLILFFLFNIIIIFINSYNHFIWMKFKNPMIYNFNYMNFKWIW